MKILSDLEQCGAFWEIYIFLVLDYNFKNEKKFELNTYNLGPIAATFRDIIRKDRSDNSSTRKSVSRIRNKKNIIVKCTILRIRSESEKKTSVQVTTR